MVLVKMTRYRYTKKNYEKKCKLYFKEYESLLKEVEVVLIDEFTMLSARILGYMDNRLRQFKNKNQNFGGMKIVLVGDPLQLPPTIVKALWETNSESENIHEKNGLNLFKTFQQKYFLKKSVRHQNDSNFESLLDRVGKMELTEEDYKQMTKNFF